MFGLDFLEAFADGFLTGVMSEWGRRRVTEPLRYTFRQHMQALAEAASLNIGRLTDESAVFLVPFRGAVYHVAVVLRRDKPQAVMHAFSNAAFPLGQGPLAVRQAMANMNGETMECDYGVLDGENTSHCCTTARRRLRCLTSDAFEQMLGGIVPRVAMLDGALVQLGYVC